MHKGTRGVQVILVRVAGVVAGMSANVAEYDAQAWSSGSAGDDYPANVARQTNLNPYEASNTPWPSLTTTLDHTAMKLAILALAASANAFTSPSSAARPAATSLKAATATLPATVKPGVVTGDALMDLLAYAKERGFAIPAVNAVSSCGINACLEAAAKFDAGVLMSRDFDLIARGPQIRAKGYGLDARARITPTQSILR